MRDLPIRSVESTCPSEFITLEDRARGRVEAESGELLVGAALDRVIAGDPTAVAIRSVIFCEAEEGICSACYGVNPGTGELAEVGAAVGMAAAVTLFSYVGRAVKRPFLLGSHTSGYRDCCCRAAARGVVGLRPFGGGGTVERRDGVPVVVAERLEMTILDDMGRQIPSGVIPYGALLRAVPGAIVQAGEVLAEWNPFEGPLLAHDDGILRWVELVEGRTFRCSTDDVTGLTEKVVLGEKSSVLRPRLQILSSAGAETQTIFLVPGDRLRVNDGVGVSRGEVVAGRQRVPSPCTSSEGGWCGLLEFIYGRTKDPAVLAEVDGIVAIETGTSGYQTVLVQPWAEDGVGIAGAPRRHATRRWAYLVVREGEAVSAGASLSLGDRDPKEVIRILGPQACALELLDCLQLLCAEQGAPLALCHAEVVVRALLDWVRIVVPGDGPWHEGQLVRKKEFTRRCAMLQIEGRRSPSAQATVVGLARRP